LEYPSLRTYSFVFALGCILLGLLRKLGLQQVRS